VDDACPDGSASAIARCAAADPRVRLLAREANGGVGAATCSGYRAAIDAGADIIVKLDGDGQMDPRLIPYFARPIANGDADYVKGNRFFSIETLLQMSPMRIVGNAGLSFITKLSTGYWDLFDPTNGFTAIEARVAEALPLEKLSRRFFFESDLLFRLGVLRARVVELPMVGHYGRERSSLSEWKALCTFPFLHLRNLWKRVLYTYFLRSFSIASLNLILGFVLLLFGVGFGAIHWIESYEGGMVSSPGTVMLAALPILLGLQMLLSFLSHDVAMVPSTAIHPKLYRIRVLAGFEDNEGRFE
jgi:glycosyltransferase involved in cell wall biosynthesis